MKFGSVSELGGLLEYARTTSEIGVFLQNIYSLFYLQSDGWFQ